MKKVLIKITVTIISLYVLLCIALFFLQEKMIFFPEKLDRNYSFQFNQNFKEMTIPVDKSVSLNGILFKADSSKGLIFYLHGNAGSLRTWGEVAKAYTNLSYDVFIMDYRGFGKSGGNISSQQQLFKDIQIVYDTLHRSYNDSNIIVLGYSIGSGLAAKLASENHPKKLILQAPYYSLTDMMEHTYPYVPTILLKYKFETYNYLQSCKMPVIIYHGNNDEVIYYGSSLKLKKLFKQSDTLITIEGQEHNGITRNKEYLKSIEKVLLSN
ncbi:MAG: alpha/beta fold hydrolase [Bacteroidia bacterium]|nr:alpha/beta fold hydrolase [Bacteroidia bacterium]